MFSISNFIFLIIFCFSIFLFFRNIKKIIRNINLGRDNLVFTDKKERWKRVFFIAFGQSKMFKKPLVAILHLIVYFGFIIINIELIEIITDGLFGTHRVFSFMGMFSEIKYFMIFTLILGAMHVSIPHLMDDLVIKCLACCVNDV